MQKFDDGYTSTHKSPSSYRTPDGSPGSFYWYPKAFKIKEIFDGARTDLKDDQIYDVPKGSLQGNDYVWNTTEGINPTIDASKSWQSNPRITGTSRLALHLGLLLH